MKEEYNDGKTTVEKFVKSLKTLQRHALQETAISKVAELMKVYFQMDYLRDAVVMIRKMQSTKHTIDSSIFLQGTNDLTIGMGQE